MFIIYYLRRFGEFSLSELIISWSFICSQIYNKIIFLELYSFTWTWINEKCNDRFWQRKSTKRGER